MLKSPNIRMDGQTLCLHLHLHFCVLELLSSIVLIRSWQNHHPFFIPLYWIVIVVWNCPHLDHWCSIFNPWLWVHLTRPIQYLMSSCCNWRVKRADNVECKWFCTSKSGKEECSALHFETEKISIKFKYLMRWGHEYSQPVCSWWCKSQGSKGPRSWPSEEVGRWSWHWLRRPCQESQPWRGWRRDTNRTGTQTQACKPINREIIY